MAGESSFNFKETVKSYRRTLNKRRINKGLPWLYPLANEKQYYRFIKEIGKPLVEKTEEIINKLDLVVNKKAHTDGWSDDLESILNELKGTTEGTEGEDSIKKILAVVATAVFLFNKKQFQKVLKPVVGFNYNMQEPWWDEMETAWRNRNYNLIKGLTDEYIKKINDVAWNGFRSGLSVKEISKQIEDINKSIFGVKYKIDPKTGKRKRKQSRAELLARDQIGKLNGELTKRRMEDIGVDIYEWLTAFDERVRGRPGGRYPKAIPSHWEMQGKLCKWSDPFVYADKPAAGEKIVWKQRTGKMPKAHPGEEIQCRCTAVVYWTEFLSEIDKEI